MLSVEDALQQVLAHARAVAEVEPIPTFEGLGRVLAHPLVSAVAVPPHDNSQMDGYAVRTADVPAAGTRLPVSQRIAAGHVGAKLADGTAARIFTGAPIPAGCDAIVMQELATVDGDAVVINEVPKPGQWIRRTGIDIDVGGTVLAAGRKLKPQDLGLAAAAGAANIDVYRRIRVAVLFTGDELVMPGEPLPPGGIYNSNRFMLCGLLLALGCEVIDAGIVPDDLDATRATLLRAANGADLIITSGGVSVGEEDHVKAAVQGEGVLDLWQIAMKPGKPLAFGAVQGVPFLGLPGNPVSSFVTFLLFARPFVLARQGVTERTPHPIRLRADFDLPKADRRREFLRARRNADGGLELFPNQNSAVLTSCVWADGLIDNPAGQTIARGDLVRFLPFADLLT